MRATLTEITARAIALRQRLNGLRQRATTTRRSLQSLADEEQRLIRWIEPLEKVMERAKATEYDVPDVSMVGDPASEGVPNAG